jgi:hypothetical protein
VIDLDWLSQFSGLRSLTLDGHYCGSALFASLAPLASLTSLHTLSLSFPEAASSVDFVMPPALHTLRVALRGTGSGDALAVIARSDTLRKLHLHTAGTVSERHIAHLCENRALESVSFYSYKPLLPGTLAALGSLPSLREFDFCGGPLSPTEQEALSDLTALTRLELDGTGIADAAVERFCERLPSLTHLSLREATVSDVAYRALPRLEQLETLEIAGHWGIEEIESAVTDAVTPYIPALPQLRRLTVASPGFTGARCDVAFWERFPALEELNLGGSAPGGAAVRGAQ